MRDVMEKIEEAARKWDVKLLAKLLESKPDLNTERGGLLLWDSLDNVEIASMLVKAGAKVNMSDTAAYNRESYKYRFLSWCASECNDEEYVKLARLMMERGANVKERTGEGETVLHLAVKQGSVALAAELLGRGADVEAKDRYGETPIHAAFEGIRDTDVKPESILQLLIKSGDADADTIKRRGVMALRHNLYGFDLTEPLTTLLELGVPEDELNGVGICVSAHFNVFDRSSYWPAHFCMPLLYACYAGHFNKVKFFADHGVDLNKQANCGKSALSIALYRNHHLCVQTLVECGADINSWNESDGRYPIHVACGYASDCSIKLLLNLGADINVEDETGTTPIALLNNNRFDGSYQTVIRHFAWLLSKGAEIIIRDLVIIHARENTKIYFDECLGEIEKMKQTTIHEDISMFDLFKKNTRETALLLKNKEFSDKMIKLKMEKFPLYSTTLENKTKLANQIKVILMEQEKILEDASHGLLPNVVLQKIIMYSNAEDIKKLRKNHYLATFNSDLMSANLA